MISKMPFRMSYLVVLVAAAAIVGLGAFAIASQSSSGTSWYGLAHKSTVVPSGTSYGPLSAHQFVGMSVVDNSGKDVGKVKDLLMDGGHQKITYALISTNLSVGLGGRYLGVPWTVLDIRNQLDSDRVHFALNLSSAQLKDAPLLVRGRWGDLDGADFQKRTDTFYRTGMSAMLPVRIIQVADYTSGTLPSDVVSQNIYSGDYSGGGHMVPSSRNVASSGEKSSINCRLVSKVIGMGIEQQNQGIGRIRDLVIDHGDGGVLYAVVSFNKNLKDAGGKWATLPWAIFSPSSDMRSFAVSADSASLRAVAYDKGSLPIISDRTFARSINQRFNVGGGIYGFVGGDGTPAAVSALSTINGVVESTDTITAIGIKDGLRLKLRTDDGQMLWVYTGPKSYVDDQKMQFSKGDHITAIGSHSIMDGRAAFLAHDINIGKLFLHLRDAQGTGLWMAHDHGTEGSM